MIDIHTVRMGDAGPLVERVQRIVAATADGIYGRGTYRCVKVWQEARGLVADGVFGRKSWAAAGYSMPPPAPSQGDRRAPACVAALRDANARYPERKRASDGIMGDTSHQARKSGHNIGNAVDISHDPDGFDCSAWAEKAYLDPRVLYVIFAGRIINKRVQPGVWRKYTGSNSHHHHMHVEIIPERRDDDSVWPWAL